MKGETVKIWEGGFKDSHTLGGGFGIEDSHIYRINGIYYITCPAGGTQGWQICLRSKHIHGPYEHHLIMDDDSSYPDNGLHQGGMVQLTNGDWWFIIMQDRGALGRVPCLLPVTWKDWWPMLGAKFNNNFKNARNTLTQRVIGPLCTATVEMDISGLRDGCVAGFGVFELLYYLTGSWWLC